ncbi:MAG: type II secretion system protein [Rhabdochlamydiaceae bacterium]
MRAKRKRYPITLLEVMIVILLIGLIGGVLSYNLKGTLDRGKKFRTEEGMKRLKEILEMEIERGVISASDLKGFTDSQTVHDCVKNSNFISSSNLDSFLKDGWKEPYQITINGNEIHVTSPRLEQYNREHP